MAGGLDFLFKIVDALGKSLEIQIKEQHHSKRKRLLIYKKNSTISSKSIKASDTGLDRKVQLQMRQGGRMAVQRRGMTKDLAVCGLFAALIAVGAFIKIVIPVGVDTMNFTLQWLFVMLAGLLLGSRRGFFSVATYLVIGLVGFPVFARGGGPAYLIRPTFGFLLGFALAAYAIGRVWELLHSSKPRVWMIAVTVGYAIYYGMGILYFYFITHFVIVTPNTVGWGAIFAVYCLPTMVPDYVLCVLAVMLAGRLRPVVAQIME